MYNKDIINSILSEWTSRSPDGLSENLTGEQNIVSLYESLVVNNIDENTAIKLTNEITLLLEKGKHPERQAYNKNGLLVTFPTPEYKARAIAKGTHTETNPKAEQSNLFGGGQQAPSQATPSGGAPSVPMDAGQSELPRSDSGQPQTPPAQKEVPEPGASGTPATPPPAPSSSTAPSVQTPAQGQLAVEPIPQTAATPQVVAQPAASPTPPPTKTTGQITAEKELIKNIMASQDVMPTIAGVGGTAMAEQLTKLTKVALEMNLTEAAKFLSKLL